MTFDKKPKTAFLGTPDFAVVVMQGLVDAGYDLACVVTQPDRPRGRGHKLSITPVKSLALELGLPVFTPISLKTLQLESVPPATLDSSVVQTPRLLGAKSSTDLARFLNDTGPYDLIVTAAYGNIIPEALINFPEHGIINVHPSLLPRWRGAAPIEHAIFSGDQKTGVAIMKVDIGLDTGAVYALEELQISPQHTLETLTKELAVVGTELLLKHLPEIIRGTVNPIAQDDALATYADKWTVEDTTINWNESSHTCWRRIRSSTPQPGARTIFNGQVLKIFDSRPTQDSHLELAADSSKFKPGQIVEIASSYMTVCCGNSSFLQIYEVQLPGKKRISVRDFRNGVKIHIGDSLGDQVYDQIRK